VFGRKGKKPDVVVPVPPRAQNARSAIVFVHGFNSSIETWSPLLRLFAEDPDFADVALRRFAYATRLIRFRPGRAIPTIDTCADKLRTALSRWSEDYDHFAIVSHSQGGLVVQRMLHRTLNDQHADELRKIRRIVLIACPNTGSEFCLTLRRWVMWRNVQERQLRPLDRAVTETHGFVLERVANATRSNDTNCPISVRAYAGEEDKIVEPQSAAGYFKRQDFGVISGDHSSVICPADKDDDRYEVIAGDLRSFEQLRGVPPTPDHEDVLTRRNVNRTLLIVVGKRSDELINRVLVKEGTEEWRVPSGIPYMLPSLPMTADVETIRKQAGLQLGLAPESFTVELYGDVFSTANANPRLGDRSGRYSFQFAIVAIGNRVRADHFSMVGDRPAWWASQTELSAHDATMDANGDVVRKLRDEFGSYLDALPASVSLD